MSKIRDLLKERSELYSQLGNKVLEEISNNVLPALIEMLDLSEQEVNKLMWTNVHEQNNHLIIAGVIKYREGDIISDGGTTVTLDATMAAMLDKIISVAVPIELAETGSQAEIVAHFKATAEKVRQQYKELYDPEINNPMDFGPDFNYNELTEEQRKSLLLSCVSQFDKGDKLN